MIPEHFNKQHSNFQKTFSPILLLQISTIVKGLFISFIFLLQIVVFFLPFYIFLLLILAFIYISSFFAQNLIFTLTEEEVIFKRNFIRLSQKRIKYTDIKEVILYQGIIQKKMKIGTVRAITQANIGGAGITLFDIKEYQAVYDFLIEKTKDNKLNLT